MRAALRESYVEFVYYMGVTEKYPKWFNKEMETAAYTDENRYTFYLPLDERTPDYYEKVLVEDYSVFIRKPNGDIYVTNYDVFNDLYILFRYDAFTNSGIAAFEQDCIEYVECKGGVVTADYPAWFYEYFTEAINLPPDDETILVYNTERHCLSSLKGSLLEVDYSGDVYVRTHCVFLRNKFNEIRGMEYKDFIKYYDPKPMGGYGY